jgi:hypothetical protein
MKNITITRTKNTVNATYLPYAAYKSAIALATEHKGEIGKDDKGNFKATFSSAKVAENFVKAWTAEYNANRKVEVAPAPKSTPTQKPKASKVWDAKYFVELAVANGDTYEDAIAEACRITAELRNAQKTSSSKPTATKGKTTSSTKKTTTPRKAKGEAFDFGKIKGKTKSDKNRALHAMLVAMGHADSRTKEYQAVWNARPWAK